MRELFLECPHMLTIAPDFGLHDLQVRPENMTKIAVGILKDSKKCFLHTVCH